MSGEFRQIEYTADIGLEVTADTPEAVFETAARALFSLLSDEKPSPEEKRSFSLTAPSTDYLLIDFLNELIFLASSEGWLSSSASVSIQNGKLTARLEGSRPPAGIKREIKAATYHRLSLSPYAGRWRAEVYFDI